jgi:hypothetical protein
LISDDTGDVVVSVDLPLLERRGDDWYYTRLLDIDLSPYIPADSTVRLFAVVDADGQFFISDVRKMRAGPPDEPLDPQPESGSMLILSPEKLDWKDSEGATVYHVVVDDEYVANDLRESKWIVDFPFSPGTHTWYVVAENACGTTAGPTWQFTVQGCTPPNEPKEPRPGAQATLMRPPDKLDWSDAAGATSYDVVLDGLVVARDLSVSEWPVTVTLTARQHFWYVIAKNDCGYTRGATWICTLRPCTPPSRPTNPTPSSGETLSASPAKLDWDDCPTPASYDVYLDGALVASWLTTSEWTLNRTLGAGSHSWYVVARNACTFTNGPTWRFTITTGCTLPSRPANPNPTNNATLVSTPVKLNWSDALNATSYDVTLDGVVVANHLTVSEWVIDRVLDAGSHTWQVKARNSCGTTNGPMWRFIIACHVPGEPEDPNPIDNATLSRAPQTLDWSDVPGATSYDVVLDGDIAAYELLESEWVVDVSLDAGPHSWYVIAKNDCGESHGLTWRFTITAGCTSPSRPANPSPANNATLSVAPVKLNWADTANASSYDVYLDDSLVASGLTISEWTCLRTLNAGAHTWYVVARNACGTTRGPEWRFNVSCSTPATPSVRSPLNGETVSGKPSLLDWNDCTRASTYDVYLDGVRVASGLTASEWRVTGKISAGTHYWFVVAQNACGSTAGPQWRFVVTSGNNGNHNGNDDN